MKKPLTTLSILALAISCGFTAVAISNSAATEQTPAPSLIDSNTDLANASTPKSLSKNQTVYIITDSTGSAVKSFVGNVINTDTEPLPLDMRIAYTLDGSEISAADLTGKSGHVTIKYEFTATKSYQDKLVPFLTVTGLRLDDTKFTNVKIDHGKIISEDHGLTIAGYTTAGLNYDLGTDLLPESFTISADVTDFALDDTYTFATNEIFAEIDTTRLDSLDSLINSINDLSTAFDQILAGAKTLATGSNDLAAGAQKLAAGSSDLASGAQKLAAGSSDLATGSSRLASGLNLLDTKVNEFVPGLQSLATGLSNLSAKSQAINSGVQTTFSKLLNDIQAVAAVTDPTTAAALTQIVTGYSAKLPTLYQSLDTYTGTVDYIASNTATLDTTELVNGITTLKSGANDLATGASQLATGAGDLATGSSQLATGANDLASGASRLATGSNTLYSGLATFKSEGINRLVNFANRDLGGFLSNVRATVQAADSYHHYGNSTATSTKFIFKTPSIK